MTDKTLQRNLLLNGALICGIAVLLGAFAAHSLKDLIPADLLQVFDTGVKFQFYHGIAVLMLYAMQRRLNEKVIKITYYLFITGIVLFSGSLYLLATRDITLGNMLKIIGPVTPIGGVLLIIAWFYLAIFGYKSRNPHIHTKESDA